jgi:molybdopterin molybdotransferase
MIPFREALDRLLASATPIAAERVALDDAPFRVLAEDIFAPFPMPAFDYSAMDGYAIASPDLTGPGPFALHVAGESAAGGELPTLAPGTACRIFTGARVPLGTFAVVMQEHVERKGDVIHFHREIRPGAHVRRRGADLAEGAMALPRGARLTPGRVALAAALDRPTLHVARRPILTVLSSGDELRSPGEPNHPGSVVESNGYFVAAAARAAGAITRVTPFVRDDPESSRAAVATALRGTDLLVTIGGVSVGDRDVIRPALEAAGVTLDFWRVKIKPGKPLAVGHAGPVHVLGLPGNPASASLTFLLFGLPLLRALQGDTAPLPPRLVARALTPLHREPGREEFLRARLKIEGGALAARVLPNQSSGAVTSFAEADALVVVPAECDRINQGDPVEVFRIADM